MNVTLKTAPTTGLLDLQEVKDHLRVDHAEDDALIQGLIDAVHQHHEGPAGVLGRTFLIQTWTGKLDAWPCSGMAIEISLPPLISVDEVRYVDSAGAIQVWASSNYQVQHIGDQPARLWPAYGVSWPGVRVQPDAIEIDFTAGYGGPEDLPPNARSAFLLMIHDLYENRGKSLDRQFFENSTYKEMLGPLTVWYL
jgi:uncharacterized phiE125 gp8 family phage protein